jgi:hypothetical protein
MHVFTGLAGVLPREPQQRCRRPNAGFDNGFLKGTKTPKSQRKTRQELFAWHAGNECPVLTGACT